MPTLDTSGLVALIDRHHEACRSSFDRERPPYFLFTAVLSELAWFLESRFHLDVETTVLADLRRDAYTLDWDAADLARIETLTKRYRHLQLGLADAAVIACAKRHGGKVLTTDRRHFPTVAQEGTITVLPDQLD